MFTIDTDDNIIQPIHYHHDDQYTNYAELDYKCIIPLVKKYFSPSVEINKIIDNIETKYNIIHDNTVAVYYRGTDKFKETRLASFDDFYNQIIKIVNKGLLITKMTIIAQHNKTEFKIFMAEKIIVENALVFCDRLLIISFDPCLK